MKVTQEKLPASRIGLEIEVPPERSQQAYEKTLQQFMKNANIPGFRKGKVPRQVIIQRFGSTQIKASVLEELIESSLREAVEQEKIDAIGNFELRSPFEQLVSQFEPGNALVISAVVDVPPEVQLTQTQGLSVQAEEVPYKSEKVDELLENYRNRSATQVPVEGRAAQEKDLAVVDFAGRLAELSETGEVQEISGGSAQDFEVELTEGRFIPGFIDGIIGMNVGETKEISATFPDPYVQEDLAGKPAIFTVTLKELKEKELPELDDDFAQEISEFETLAELRESLESRFKSEAEDKTKSNRQEALLNELVKYLEAELPETLIRREVDYMITQTAMRFGNQGMDVKKMFTPEIVQMLREQSRPEAIARLKRTLALGEIAKAQSIKVEPAEIDAKAKEVMADLSDQDVDPDRLRQVVEEDLLRDKIFEWLEANNSIELVPEGTLTQEEEADTEAAVTAPETDTPAEAATVEVEAVQVTDEAEAPVEAPEAPAKASKAAKAADSGEAPAKSSARKKSGKSKKSEESADSED